MDKQQALVKALEMAVDAVGSLHAGHSPEYVSVDDGLLIEQQLSVVATRLSRWLAQARHEEPDRPQRKPVISTARRRGR